MQGQVNRGSTLGNIIYNMCKQDDIKTIVEIGTWNGMGTTKCIYDAIVDSKKTNYLVYSLESNKSFYNEAINNFNNFPKIINFNLLLGRIINPEDMLNIDNDDDKFFSIHSKNIQKEWLKEDIYNCNNVECVLDMLPQKIDLLILDGGEFSTLAEFNILKDKTTYFILDDTLALKNFEVSNIMRNDKKYEILFDEPNDRNGFLISKIKDHILYIV
jgi:hypothetical protein